jgi:hypothetical protein
LHRTARLGNCRQRDGGDETAAFARRRDGLAAVGGGDGRDARASRRTCPPARADRRPDRRERSGSFAAFAAKLRPALVGLGSFKDGHFSAVVLGSAETGPLVRALRRDQAGAQPDAAGPAGIAPGILSLAVIAVDGDVMGSTRGE